MFSDSLAMETWVPASDDWDRKVVASFAEEGVLLSGWLLGEDVIARKAAVVDTRYKKGRIILIGIACQMPGPVARDLQVPAERPALPRRHLTGSAFRGRAGRLARATSRPDSGNGRVGACSRSFWRRTEIYPGPF